MILLVLTLVGMVLLMAGCFGRMGLVRLARLRLQGGLFALLAYLVGMAGSALPRYRLELLLVSAVLLARFCWLNRRRGGMWLIALGIALNMLVMTANGGMMPINSTTLAHSVGRTVAPGTRLPYSNDMVIDDNAAALAWLGDRLVLPGPLAHVAVWSIGDLILLVGVGWMLWSTMKGDDSAVHPVWEQATLS